ncbi:conserved protein of unknown function [Methylococcus capsulatus]|uniref:Uncharacterized protein n=1 Tax=Methylococcus capsulatus TaxID=414 RepID=A0AA35XZB6_METCP|nr:conserved protein of unknown function [Methylococcus capsulatus]
MCGGACWPPARALGVPVYPRVCGGAMIARLPFRQSEGLSPRVRGSQQGPGEFDVKQWSIPACAGEPPRIIVMQQAQRVYPRVCGGASHTHVVASVISGLSPRVRGSHRRVQYLIAASRSIPACAGEP